ncbi:ICEBs1 excisionase [Bacillus pumilus]|uniref:ICEBs1 excisionase n=1 Tax=Bacillus pumilus TaxID=1408 RepID=UPI0011AA4267|nr:ICEBs1 excisionase [Bacillus pumilus]
MKEFLDVNDIMKIMDVSQNKAYKMIRELNSQLKDNGFKVMKGKVNKSYFESCYYATKEVENINEHV